MITLRFTFVLLLIASISSSVFSIEGDYDFSSNIAPSQTPPGGVQSSKAPQFVVIGSDDNAMGEGIKWFLDLIQGKKNPKGSSNPLLFEDEQITMSFYSNSQYFANPQDTNWDPTINPQLKRAYALGCEVSNHTHTHAYFLDPDTKKRLDSNAIKKEINDCNKLLKDSIGVKPEHIKGFRTPYLAYTDSVYTVEKSIGFTYDCSMEEGNENNQNAGNYYWPYTLDYAAPGNDKSICWWNQTYNAPIRKHPGLWILACYLFNAPPDNECAKYGIASGFIKSLDNLVGYETGGKLSGLDYNMWADTGDGGFRMNKAQSIAVLEYTFDQHYKGNRSPFTIGTHSQDYVLTTPDFPNIPNPADKKAVMETFLSYITNATKYPDVRIVSGAKAIAWCMKPIALGTTPIVTNAGTVKNKISITATRKGELTVSVRDQGIYSIAVHSFDGKLVKRIENIRMGQGSYSLNYDAKNIGVKMYVVSVTGTDVRAEQKLLLY